MGRRRNWNAVRMVAEDIAIGDRSYRNLTKRPDLPTCGFAAIEELHRRGLIKASFGDDLVEPTEAYWSWLETLRLAEAQQAAAQQNSPGSPGRESLANTQAAIVSTLPSASETRSPVDAVAPAVIKPRRPQVNRPDLSHVDQMCVRIVDFMSHNGRRLPYSTIRRGVNAYRYPGLLDFAFQRLHRALKIEEEPGTRRKWVTLLEVPEKYAATRLPPERRRHRPRSRGQTPWFQEFIDERELED